MRPGAASDLFKYFSICGNSITHLPAHSMFVALIITSELILRLSLPVEFGKKPPHNAANLCGLVDLLGAVRVLKWPKYVQETPGNPSTPYQLPARSLMDKLPAHGWVLSSLCP